MPYISEEARSRIKHGCPPTTPGELNYCITLLLTRYMAFKGGPNYATINDILGALDGAGKEFYRRVAAPYEDRKRAENGEVYALPVEPGSTPRDHAESPAERGSAVTEPGL